METDDRDDCASYFDIVTEDKENTIIGYDNYGRIYGRSRTTKKYQTSCKRLSRRKSRINKR